jgi:outer membrane biosynthesis protein TonB
MCYEHATRRAPDLRGKVVLRIFVDAQGDVADAEVEDAAPRMDGVAHCLLRRVQQWKGLPCRSAWIAFPFVFTPT